MTVALMDITILGVHKVDPSQAILDEALELQWGDELEGDELKAAQQQVADHFSRLFLIEVKLMPPDADLDWGEFTQAQDDVDESEWQVAYDERPVDEEAGTWTFFLHQVDLTRPIHTPLGARSLPAATPRPAHLQSVEYEVP